MMNKNSRFVENLILQGILQEEDKDNMLYGLYSLKILFINLATLLLVGVFFSLIFHSIIFFFSFAILRMYAGGYHYRSPVKCYFFSFAVIVSTLAIIKFMPNEIMPLFSIIALSSSMPIILVIAPIETPNKLLDEMEKKHYRKKTLIVLFFEIIIVILLFLSNFNDYAFTICLSIFLVNVVVLMQKISEQNRKKENNK